MFLNASTLTFYLSLVMRELVQDLATKTMWCALCDHATVALRSTCNGIKCNTCSLVEVILTKPMKSWTSLSSKSAFQKAVGGRRRDRACEREEVSEVQTNGWCCGVWIHARGGWRCPGAERDSCAECEHSLELNSKSQTNLKPRT